MISGEDIGRQKYAGYMTDVQWAIGIRPSQGYKNLFRHMASPVEGVRKKSDQQPAGPEVEITILPAGR